MKKRIFLVSTAHPPTDPRIVVKLCATLAGLYEVTCALPRADASVLAGVRFWRLPYFRRVWWRVLLVHPVVLWRGLWLRPAVVHILVPELIPVGLVFRLFGVRVVYEVQENLYKKLHVMTLNRGYGLERAFRWFDQLARQYFYLIFTEHAYLDTYTNLAKPHAIIYNYPLLPFLDPFRQPYRPSREQPSFFLIGLLSEPRAFDTLIMALSQLILIYPNLVVHLFGRKAFTDAWMRALPGFIAVENNLRFYGYAAQDTALPYTANATAGLALLKPVGDYPDSYPTKLFEYMALGLPVVTSDFPLYRPVVEQHGCGLCVSAADPLAIADALRYLIDHPVEAQAMGERGRQAVESGYVWATEADKLRQFYQLIELNNKTI